MLHAGDIARQSHLFEDASRNARSWLVRFQRVRSFTERICAPLLTEDYVVQTMPDVSPPKWHLGHTTWFFEKFVLQHMAERVGTAQPYRPFHPRFDYLFNSYYEALGERVERPRRGLLSRPSVDEIYWYRADIDQKMAELLQGATAEELAVIVPRLELGLQHEQQHQELLVTDIKHIIGTNPLRPGLAYDEVEPPGLRMLGSANPEPAWIRGGGKLATIGFEGEGFSFDNERGAHQVWLEPFELRSSLVTNGEYLEFMEAGGYETPGLWLSDGWAAVQRLGWGSPLYWEHDGGSWSLMTMRGMAPLDPDEPVCHVSYYEADAFARWKGARLATEAEWESIAREEPAVRPDRADLGNFAESMRFHPRPGPSAGGGSAGRMDQLFGDVWEWTMSAYLPYPGFRTMEGALGEYNGKFMSGQMVLRGGSCATAADHVRPSYRNFFPPDARWQFSGIRLARDAR